MELVWLFSLVLFLVTSIFGISKYYPAEKLKPKLLVIGGIFLLSLWIGLFLETPEMEYGAVAGIIITGSFLFGLSIFFLFFFQVFSEKFYNLPQIDFHYHALQSVFLNLFCLLNSILILFVHISIEIKLLVTSLLSHAVTMTLHVLFYHRKYNKITQVPLTISFSVYLFFALISFLYFAIGFMALFVLTPFHIPELK